MMTHACMQRMRDIINKGLTNEELLRGVKTAWDKGWKQVTTAASE